KPLAGTALSPSASWLNISSTVCYRSTINSYLKEAKARNMKSMFYNLCYGALNDAAKDGVKDEWSIFEDRKHTNKVTLYLSQPFKSNIYLLDPGNEEWLDYMTKQVADVYSAYDFDGYHIDQVGIRDKFNYEGNPVDLPAGFQTFINRMKASFPSKYNVFNAVGSFGQKKIAESNVDFQYYEVWNEAPGYADLKTIIDNNATYTDNKKNTVLAAYMNYSMAEHKGTFNTPGVLMTEAVIFALGGSHIELGEHMLGKEYFPNSNLEMSPLLDKSVIAYYDFLVAYENLLRDGGQFNVVPVTCSNGKASIVQWPPQTGKVIALSKLVGTRQVVHLLNFTNAVHLNWCDADGTQAEPLLIKSMPVSLTVGQTVKKAWAATPDSEGSLYQELPFSQQAGTVTFQVPALKYWTMIVLEF
ncbi:MAG: glycoside hydrolase family 66 protein, partial [Bacteroidota bacterium]|nr:glycoside hydrolase family 66 protein [Bacteroidota bacterium]